MLGTISGGEIMAQEEKKMIILPKPKIKGAVSLEESIKKRRSRRSFLDKSLTLEQVSQLLWAAQGITDERTGFRASPSGGACYPLDIYLLVGKNSVEGLDAGVYHYIVSNHSLKIHLRGDKRRVLALASFGQMFIAQAPISLITTVEYSRITSRYGRRGVRYAHIEVGHVGENIYLQAETLGLGTVAVGAFSDGMVSKCLNLSKKHEPLYIMPVGYPKRE
ncbi:MAG: SagB/ThcOx family dehydrogenase [Firmicutes bacterium]|nr:SagB/ThcOx family dehydrogenase [Bacillota bacterium]